MPLNVALVAADREVWKGEADMVIAKTVEGDIGVLPGHEPLLGVLAGGIVEIRSGSSPAVVVAVDGGFLSVSADEVSVLAEQALLPDQVDNARAQEDLRAAESSGDGSALRWARARLDLAGRQGR